MARRRAGKSSLLDDLSTMPWWVSAGLAVFVFITCRFIVPSMEMQSFVAKGLQTALPSLAWLISAVLLVPAVISAFRAWQDGKQSSESVPITPRVQSPKPIRPGNVKRAKPTNQSIKPEVPNAAVNMAVAEKPSTWAQEILADLEWKRYEELCRAYFEAKGFTSKLSRVGADGGVDIHLFKGSSEKPIVLVQCKAWNTYKVGVKPVRELFGVMASEGVPQGVFMTTGEFTGEAKEFAKGKKLVLVTGSALFQSIKAMPEEIQAKLLAVATEGDYTTPSCAKCDTKMVLRSSKKATGEGEEFWGCTNFPRCRMTLKLRAA